MKPNIFLIALILLCFGCTMRDSKQKQGTWSDQSNHKSSFLNINGIRLNYLDWGGKGPTLILIHGYADNPHVFDDLAPAFADKFRVIAYARRGHGLSDTTGTYSSSTLTEDLHGLMDSLGIAKANLAGWSMGGNEITDMAVKYPDRVGRIIYLEGAYDWGDPAFADAFKAAPPIYLNTPASVLTSLDAWRTYQKTFWFPTITDMSRLEAYVRELVIIQPDGSVRLRMSDNVAQSLLNVSLTTRREYSKVLSPVLAIYAESMFDVRYGDTAQCAANRAWEQKYMAPFRASSIARIQKELHNVEILKVHGTHMDFLFISREQVVEAMLKFLSQENPKN
jgi:pimeloyl-ACP methyl ester carboxylesterase